MKRVDGDTSDLGDFNDVTSSLEMMKTGDVPTGKIVLHKSNDGLGTIVCSVSTTSDKTCKFKEDDEDCGCDNDDARSAKLKWVKPGTKIKVYDDPGGDPDEDDWTEIKVKRLFKYRTIDSFEDSYEDDYVKVTYHKDNGLDGKVSHMRIEAP